MRLAPGRMGRAGFIGAGLVAVVGALLAACGNNTGGGTPTGGNNNAGNGGANGGGNTASQPTYQIGLIAKSNSNAVFLAARQGAYDAARVLGAEMGCEVEILWKAPNTEDAQAQAQYVELLASQGVDGIAISCTDANVLTPAINDAVDNGVTVVTFDSDAADSRRMAFYGVDDRAAGAKVMELLAAELNGQGEVAILAGNPAAPNLQARVAGVIEEAARHPGIRIIDTYYHGETAAEAAARMQQVQTANPRITGWALVGGWPLYTDNALDGVHEHAKVVSMDPLELPLDYMIAGQVQALVGQPYYDWGYESVRLILNKVHRDQTPENPRITVAPEVVATAEAARERKGRWGEWLRGAPEAEGN